MADWVGRFYKRELSTKFKWRDRQTGEVGTAIKEIKVPDRKEPIRTLVSPVRFEPINATPKGENPRSFSQAKKDARSFHGMIPTRRK